MALSITYPDKIIAGLWHSLTVTSEAGPPEGDVLLDGKPLERRIIPMRAPLWKITFLVAKEGAGKPLVVKLRNPAAALEETKTVDAG